MSTPDATVDISHLSQDSLPTPDAMMAALLEQQTLLEEKDEVLEKQSADIKNLQALNNVLEEKLRLMNQRKFGTSSEMGMVSAVSQVLSVQHTSSARAWRRSIY